MPAGSGEIALCPLPGRHGDYPGDMSVVWGWGPTLVLSMTEQSEMEEVGAGQLAQDLAKRGINWLHLPIRDFGAPAGATLAAWPVASTQARAVLLSGGRVLVHCFGGCGRSGMATLRILCELGVEPAAALARLRTARPCAVETTEQMVWAQERTHHPD